MNRREFSRVVIAASLGAMAPRGLAQSIPPAFRFSVMLWTIDGRLPFDRCVGLVAAAGYNGIELVEEYARWTAEEMRRQVARIHSLGLTVDAISGVHADFSDPRGGDDLLTKLTSQIAKARELGCAQIILLSGKRNPQLGPEAQMAASIENLKRAGDLAAKHGIQLLIEPIDPIENPHIYLTSVAEGFKIVRAIGNEHVQVLYDFYHEQQAGGDLLDKLRKNIDFVGLVHIADVPGRHEPGTGEIDYRNIYRTLAELNYRKFIAMEFYPTRDPLESLRTARQAAIAAASSKATPYLPR